MTENLLIKKKSSKNQNEHSFIFDYLVNALKTVFNEKKRPVYKYQREEI